MNCKICGSPSVIFANHKILDRYLITYYQCSCCRFIQTEEPYWLEEAYAQAINQRDIGIIARNITNSVIARAIISVFFNPDSRFVDYGGGYGIFVRHMRDHGFAFYRYDRYCQNLFAEGFDLEGPPAKTFELVTAFEVFEHFSDPVGELDKILELSSNILFTTTLLPSSNPKPEAWCYYGPAHGQHISFYTSDALRHLATSKHLNFYTNNLNIHLFTRNKLTNYLFKLFCINKVAFLFNLFNKRKSLLSADDEKISNKQTV